MKKLFIVLFVLAFIATYAPAQGKQVSFRNRLGMICNIELVKPVVNYTDSVLTGAGIKYWPIDEVALRGLVFVNILNDKVLDETTTNMGFSIAFEYHFIKGIVSPYAGALGGIEILSDPAQTGMDYHIGGLFGVEISTPLEYLDFFLEYCLSATFREQEDTVDLGKDHMPSLGIVIYFN
jgi:hypothetical protein